MLFDARDAARLTRALRFRHALRFREAEEWCVDVPTVRRLVFYRWLFAMGRLSDGAGASDVVLPALPIAPSDNPDDPITLPSWDPPDRSHTEDGGPGMTVVG